MESVELAWKVVVILLHGMVQNRDEWKMHLEDGFNNERMDALRDSGLAQAIERRRLNATDAASFAYVLDRCCGVAGRDFGCPRRYCDHIFIQAFLDWCGGRAMILNMDRSVTRLSGRTAETCMSFEFKMVHYKDSPEHFNAIIDRGAEANGAVQLMRERVWRLISESCGCAYWDPRCIDP
eukprot:6263364-Pyramimonas_sp.AAC.1